MNECYFCSVAMVGRPKRCRTCSGVYCKQHGFGPVCLDCLTGPYRVLYDAGWDFVAERYSGGVVTVVAVATRDSRDEALSIADLLRLGSPFWLDYDGHFVRVGVEVR